MKNKLLGLLAASLIFAGAAEQAEAQVRVHIPGTGINVNVGDPYYRNRPYYNRYHRNDNDNHNRGFWVDARGRARYNNGYYTGWRGNRYYQNGVVVRQRNGNNIIWIR